MIEIEPLIAYLYSADARSARDQLVALGNAAVESLIAVLNSQREPPDLSGIDGFGNVPDGSAARERAAYLLGDIGDQRAVAPLIAAYTRETDRYIRLAIALALGKIGDARAVETLIAALETPAWTPDYAQIVGDLARLGGERAVEPLLRLARSPDYTYGAAARAVKALAARQTDPRVLDGLIKALRLDAEIATVEAVIAALAEAGSAGAAQALLAFFGTIIQLPAERWDDREANLSESDQGVVFHVLKTQFEAVVAALRKIGSPSVIAELDRLLNAAPAHMPAGQPLSRS